MNDVLNCNTGRRNTRDMFSCQVSIIWMITNILNCRFQGQRSLGEGNGYR